MKALPGDGSDHLTPEILASLAELDEGMLPADEARRHLSRCRHCLAIYAEFTRAHLRHAVEPLADRPPELLLSKARAIPVQASATGLRVRSRVTRRSWPAVAAAAAGLTAALFVTWQALEHREVPLSIDVQNAIALQLREDAGGLLYAGNLVPQPGDTRGDHASNLVDLATLKAALEKGSPDTAFWLLASLVAEGHERDASPFLHRAISRFANDARFRNLAAIHAYKASRLDDAEKELRAALKLDRDPAYVVNLAQVLEEKGRSEEAKLLRDEVLGLPDVPSAVLERAKPRPRSSAPAN